VTEQGKHAQYYFIPIKVNKCTWIKAYLIDVINKILLFDILIFDVTAAPEMRY